MVGLHHEVVARPTLLLHWPHFFAVNYCGGGGGGVTAGFAK